MAKGQNKAVLYRVVKFEVRLSSEQIRLLQHVSANLTLVWNEALAVRQASFNQFIAPLYDQIKKTTDPIVLADLREQLKNAFKKHRVSLFDQINALTGRRASDVEFSLTPRNWQEETLDTLDGSYKSFLSLRKKGDPDARPPKERMVGAFGEIVGRYGFKVSPDKTTFQLSCGKISPIELVFSIPEYQQWKLSTAVAIKKFTLYRDERNMSKPGQFWVSLAYEAPRPETEMFSVETAVFVALGASSIGVISNSGQEVIKLWRPDKHWVPKLNNLMGRMELCTKGSRTWKKRQAAKRKMQQRMSGQQKLDHREIVAELLKRGKHFVVSDIVIRSKMGKLADSQKPERGGTLGLNWAVQNTGSIAQLVAWLEEKVKECGGSVQKHSLTPQEIPQGQGHENKLAMVQCLRESFLNASKQK